MHNKMCLFYCSNSIGKRKWDITCIRMDTCCTACKIVVSMDKGAVSKSDFGIDILQEKFQQLLKLGYTPVPTCDINYSNISNDDIVNNQEDVEKKKQHSCHTWKAVSRLDLLSLSIPSLQHLLEKMHFRVEEVSTELVSLLQERHGLQDEVDIRYIAIEQLLKVPEKFLSRSAEPLTAQIATTVSQTDIDALECQ